jgi:CRISPR-associated protein Cas2
MMILITYDVNTTTPEGRKRLRLVAKACLNHGQRVQNSVFECVLDATQDASLRFRLRQMIDPTQDSIRFYRLGNNWKNRVEHFGAKASFDPEGVLMI